MKKLSDQIHINILDQLSEGVNVTDTNGKIIYTNNAFNKMFGYKKHELIGKHVSILNALDKKSNDNLILEIIKMLKSKGNWEGEFKSKKKNGNAFITKAKITSLHLDKNTYWISTQENITDNRKKELELQETKERFRIAFEQSNSGIVLNNLDGSFLDVNPAFCKMLGYSFKEIMNMSVQEITHADYQEASKKLMKKAYTSTFTSFQMEKKYIQKNGNEIWGDTSVSLIKDTNNKPSYLLAQVQDITVRKKS